MAENESEQGPGRIRKCLWCREAFEPKTSRQLFCKRKCTSRAFKARQRDRQQLQEDPVRKIVPEQKLFELQQDRDRLGADRLTVDEFLEVRAGVMEAEEQLRQWSKRLADRRSRLLTLKEPPLTRNVQILLGDEPLIVPGRTTAIGIVSTDGLLGVAIYGTPH